jgi:hypothetical protein
VPGSGRWKDLADTALAFKVDRTPGKRTIERITIWAAKDRDDCVETLGRESSLQIRN